MEIYEILEKRIKEEGLDLHEDAMYHLLLDFLPKKIEGVQKLMNFAVGYTPVSECPYAVVHVMERDGKVYERKFSSEEIIGMTK